MCERERGETEQNITKRSRQSQQERPKMVVNPLFIREPLGNGEMYENCIYFGLLNGAKKALHVPSTHSFHAESSLKSVIFN